MRTNILAYVLGTPHRQTIVRTLLEYPKRQWSCTHLEEITKLPHATVFRCLRGLRDFGMFKSYRINKKDLIYELVPEWPFLPQLQRSLTLDQDIAKTIAQRCIKEIKSPYIKAAILYGSSVHGHMKPESDIDILLTVSKHDVEKDYQIYDQATGISSNINKTISIVIMDLPEIKKEKDSPFLTSIREKNEVLYGKIPF